MRQRKRNPAVPAGNSKAAIKARRLIDAARAAVSTFDNKMFAEMYIHAVEQQINGNNAFIRLMKEFKQPPVSIEEFLDSEDFFGATDLELWPEVRRAIIDINKNWWKGHSKDRAESAKTEALLMGATSTGKSEISKVTTAYHLHILGCLKNPQAIYGLPGATSIVFVIQAAKPHVTKKVIYQPLRNYIESIPWFQRHMRPDRLIESEMYFVEKNIRVVQGGSDADAVLGEAIIGGVLDEINFMNVVKKSKKAEVTSGRAGVYDQAQVVYDTVTRRKKGRFAYLGQQIGVICVASSTRYKGDFTDKRKQQVEEAEDATTFVYEKAQYEVKPWENRYCGETFRVCVENDASMDIRILEPEQREPTGATVFEVPIEYKPDFAKDASGSLRDIIGRSVNSVSPFFRRRPKISDAVERGIEAELESFLLDDNVILGLQGMPVVKRGHYCKNPSKPRYVHIDLSNTEDRCGIAMVRYDGLVPMERSNGHIEMLPKATVEMAVSIEPDHGVEIDIAEIRSWVRHLKVAYGYPIRAVSYDGWNCVSVDTEVWTSRGLIRAGDVEVGDIVQTRSGPQPVEKTWGYGVASTLTVTTQHGHSITMTDRHKIEALSHWSWEGGKRVPNWVWVRAGHLEEGQVVRIWDQPSEVDVSGLQSLKQVDEAAHNKYFRNHTHLNVEAAAAIGLLHGDGSFGNTYFTITCDKHERQEAERVLMDAFDFESRITWRQKDDSNGYTAQVTNTAFMRFLEANGLSSKYVVPEIIKRSPLRVQAAFISGLLAADGSVKERDGQVSIETVSKNYAEYLMHILSMGFGLPVNLTIREGRECTLPHGGTAIVSSFIVSLRGSRADFLDRIGIEYQCKQDRVEAHRDVVGRVIFSKVASIIESEAEVVDFQVRDDHSYMANGFVSHNSLESRQQWKKQGMKTGHVTVDRKPSTPYKNLRDAFYDDRIDLYPQDVLTMELYDLEYDEKADKVDHPPHSSKDVADAVCGAYYTMLRRSSTWVESAAGDVSDPNMLNREDYGDRFDSERPI